MYHYANQPGRTAQRVRQIISEAFNTSVNGLPGNDGKRPSFVNLKINLNTYMCCRFWYDDNLFLSMIQH